ncbi:sensor histidine kinase [Streptomyces sp. MAR4 CNX-425]|uniref:sensor histidine kinase n=1 Tax=Streptomyces sp. MAR4 CNX-425 TaxID=3406343 RepID=UPI003B503754
MTGARRARGDGPYDAETAARTTSTGRDGPYDTENAARTTSTRQDRPLESTARTPSTAQDRSYDTESAARTTRARAARLAASPDGPVVAAALLALLAAVDTVLRADSGDRLTAALLLAFGATAPVALLRTHPVPAAVLVTAANTPLLALLGAPVAAGAAAQALLLHRLARHGTRRVRAVAVLLVLPLAGYAVGDPGTADGGRLDDAGRLLAVAAAVLLSAATATGLAHRARSAAAAHDATERAIAHALYEHAARGERARIARELHDVVAHHISMISVQAETARLTTPGLPADGARHFRDIGDTARTALTEMRRLLGVLRDDAGAAPAARRPPPGLAELNELLDDARDAAGAAVRLIVSGSVRPLGTGVELTAYRIVQEALTNARRHAPGAAVDVEVHYADTALLLRIRDNGPGPAAPVRPGSGGHGLPGMRERAAAVGGRLRSGPAVGGGFLLEATLPVQTPASPDATPDPSADTDPSASGTAA